MRCRSIFGLKWFSVILLDLRRQHFFGNYGCKTPIFVTNRPYYLSIGIVCRIQIAEEIGEESMRHCRYPMGKRLLIILSTWNNTRTCIHVAIEGHTFCIIPKISGTVKLRYRHKQVLTIYRWVFVNSAVDILEHWHIAKAVFHEYPARQGMNDRLMIRWTIEFW